MSSTTIETSACRDCRTELAELLLAPAEASATARTHVAACAACADELAALHATMETMDAWTAPEPSAFFDTRLYARLREQVREEPAGWMERLRNLLSFNQGRQLRPLLAGALALATLIGGGAVAGMHVLHPADTRPSATVNDLKILDNNDQALQQMNQLLNDSDGDGAAPPTS